MVRSYQISQKKFVRGLPLGYISATLDDIGFERRFSYLLFLPHFLSKSSKRFLISNNFVCHIFFKELFFGALFSTLAINNCTRGLPLGVVAYKLYVTYFEKCSIFLTSLTQNFSKYFPQWSSPSKFCKVFPLWEYKCHIL